MSRTFLLTGILLLLAAGCRSTESIEQLQSGRRSGCNAVTILAPLSNDLTRTTLRQDGDTYNIYWALNDTIGVFSSGSNNAQFVLSEIGDVAAFRGLLAGEPTCAYYPYAAGSGNDPTALSMNLPALQEQTGEGPNMAYDLKSGQRLGGSAQAGYTFTFAQKLTLLRFTLTPNAALSGDLLYSITISAPSGRRLAGDYTLDITSAEAVPAFAEEGASNQVTVSFAAKPQLSSGIPVVGYVFINPDIAKGDSLLITIDTDCHTVTTLSATAGDAFVRGAIYEIGLNIATLLSQDKIEINLKDSWANNVSAPGYYTISGTAATPVHQYEPFKDQYAWSTTVNSCSFRIQSMKKGMLTKMTVPSDDAEVGDQVDLALSTIHGNSGLVEETYEDCLLVRDSVAEGYRAWWLQSQDRSKGFVIWVVFEEEE
ncbi:MAG: fimbrillin family protein [Bacteroidales bacterium]|nr:fimbrillin family protein [Bacteroidales bacterium]